MRFTQKKWKERENKQTNTPKQHGNFYLILLLVVLSTELRALDMLDKSSTRAVAQFPMGATAILFISTSINLLAFLRQALI